MGRGTIFHPGKEHPNPCQTWKNLCKEGKISYRYAVCDCSQMERTYEILENEKWKPVFKCPSCFSPINNWQSTMHVLSDKPYTIYDELQDLKKRVEKLEKKRFL